MKTTLVVTGILATIALLFPRLVTLGYFLFIVPGLVLSLAPTVFAYLATTMAIQSILPIAHAPARTSIAFGIALLLGWAVMQPFHARGRTRFQAMDLAEVVADTPIALSGNVRIENIGRHPRDSDISQCDYICAAVLDMPNVDSVTMATNDESVGYALVSAQDHPQQGLSPVNPGRVLRELCKYVRSADFGAHGDLSSAEKAINARWALRLAGNERLVSQEPKSPENADWTIRVHEERKAERANRPRKLGAEEYRIQRVEIVDANGMIRFRKSRVHYMVPARLFSIAFRTQGLQNAWFEIGRESFKSGGRYELQIEPTLLSAIEVANPLADGNLIADLRAEVIRALDNPTSEQVRLDLAKHWLSLFQFNAKESDFALIQRIVADERIQNISNVLDKAFPADKIPVEMRVAYGQRILMDHSTAKDRLLLAKRLASMPPGTFADPAPVHRAIWNDSELRKQTAPFVARIADMDPATAAPALLAALEDSLHCKTWGERRAVVKGIKDGFAQLGPDAAATVPRIQELFLQRPSPIMNNAREADDWRFTLVRMGASIDELFFPTQSEQQIEREKNRFQERYRRYQKEQSSRGKSA